jgi:integrase
MVDECQKSASISTEMARKKEQKYPRVRRRKNPSGKVSWLVDLSKKIPRERVFFKTKEAAEIFAQQKRVEYENFGTSWEEMPETVRAEAFKLWRQLRDVGGTLSEAVSFYFKHARPDGGERTVKDVIEEMLSKRLSNGRSAAYLQVQRSVLGVFAKGRPDPSQKPFEERKIHTIMSRDIEQWIAGNSDWKPRTRLNYQHDLSTLWNYALKHKYVAHNPLERLEAPIIPSEPPGILTVKQAKALLGAALEKRGGDMLPFISIGLFAGLRSAEIERLDWSEIDLDDGLIEVTAKKAKTRQRRHVTLSDNLTAWLRKTTSRVGLVTPPGAAHDKVVALAEGVGIKPWPRNALRHSFASYHLAKHKDAGRTALELGHANQNMLFRNYRELVKPTMAEDYWKLMPDDQE